MYIGAHTSIAGGFDKCIDRISEMGGNCLMTFASSPRSLQYKDIDPKSIKSYLEKKQLAKIGPHFFHGVYLANLAAESKSHLKASMDSLIFYQQLTGEIGGVGTIFHLGSHKGLGFEKVMNQVVASINYILDSSPKGIRLILENAAGQNGTIGSLKELSQILSRVGDKSKIGICLDTQHSFASGIGLETLLDQFDQIVGIKHLTVVHLNDSKSDFNSHLDRHENLGEGKIGSNSLRKFLADSRLNNIPIILEVPGAGAGPRKEDIDTLKSYVGN